LFKARSIFIFSLVPLALVFAGVIIGSMRGVDAEREIFPTQAPSASSGPVPTAPAGATSLEITASNLAFDKSSLSARAGQPVQIVLHNRDAGVLHNVSVYTNRSASQKIFTGELHTGPGDKTYSFTAPSQPGTFFFRCDVHPDTMTGNFIVQ
jgi:plastocyanin